MFEPLGVGNNPTQLKALRRIVSIRTERVGDVGRIRRYRGRARSAGRGDINKVHIVGSWLVGEEPGVGEHVSVAATRPRQRLGRLKMLTVASARSWVWSCRWIVIALLAFALPAPAGAGASAGDGVRGNAAASATGDRAATHELLQAEYELAKATLDRTPAVEAAVARAAKALGRECKGVLRGAPDESALEDEGPFAPKPKLSGRAQGERARSEQEKQTIELEVYETIFVAAYRVLRGPYEAFVNTTEALTWSDPNVHSLVHEKAVRFGEDLGGPPVAACADMRTWAASGFHLLPPASKSLQEAREARGDAPAAQRQLDGLLRSYEGPAERKIVRRTAALKEDQRQQVASEGRLLEAEDHMELAFGEKVSRFAMQRLAPVIGKGRTTAGTTFVVRRSVGRSLVHSCRPEVVVEFSERHGGSSSSVCLGKRADLHPSGGCSSSLADIELGTPPNVRRVRVRLSDRRAVTVAVVRIPVKDGGPAAIFVDAFRRSGSHPVSLQELDRNGKVVRTVGVNVMRCWKGPAGVAPTPLQFVNLATARTPSGETLTITGMLHRFEGHTEFFLEPQAGIRNSQASEETGKPEQFQWHLSTECAPHPYTLFDGILKPPGASVLVRTPAGLAPLAKVELAASIPAGGPLFYGVYPTPPTEVVVERADGSVLYTESLAAKATEETEFCEGYAEH